MSSIIFWAEESYGEVPKNSEAVWITTPLEEGTGRAAESPMADGVPCRMSEWEEL
jgi:hypothetical protein